MARREDAEYWGTQVPLEKDTCEQFYFLKSSREQVLILFYYIESTQLKQARNRGLFIFQEIRVDCEV